MYSLEDFKTAIRDLENYKETLINLGIIYPDDSIEFYINPDCTCIIAGAWRGGASFDSPEEFIEWMKREGYTKQ